MKEEVSWFWIGVYQEVYDMILICHFNHNFKPDYIIRVAPVRGLEGMTIIWSLSSIGTLSGNMENILLLSKFHL